MKRSKVSPAGTACPCGSSLCYERCCARLHAGEPAADAEALMRSRYSAYVLGLSDYLLATWHPSTRPATLDLTVAPQWLGLSVKRHATDATRAVVEFVARYKIGGRAHRLHEISRFVFDDDRWYYVDGELH